MLAITPSTLGQNSGGISNNGNAGGDIFRHHGPGPYHGACSDSQTWKDRRPAPDAGTVFNPGLQADVISVATFWVFVIRESDVGANMNIVTNTEAIP